LFRRDNGDYFAGECFLLLHFIDFDDFDVGGQRAGLDWRGFRLIHGKFLNCKK
jgi:hypothetical protein